MPLSSILLSILLCLWRLPAARHGQHAVLLYFFEDISRFSSTFCWFHKADFILSKLGDGPNGWSKIPDFSPLIFCPTSRNCCTELCPRTAAIASTTTDILNGTLYHCRQRKEALRTCNCFASFAPGISKLLMKTGRQLEGGQQSGGWKPRGVRFFSMMMHELLWT